MLAEVVMVEWECNVLGRNSAMNRRRSYGIVAWMEEARSWAVQNRPNPQFSELTIMSLKLGMKQQSHGHNALCPNPNEIPALEGSWRAFCQTQLGSYCHGPTVNMVGTKGGEDNGNGDWFFKGMRSLGNGERNTIDVYTIQGSKSHTSKPFLTDILLKDKNGRTVEEEGMVNDGAMVNAIDSGVYNQLKRKIGGWKPLTLDIPQQKLEESANTVGGVIEKSLTLLDREVMQLFTNIEKSISNQDSQHSPVLQLRQWRRNSLKKNGEEKVEKQQGKSVHVEGGVIEEVITPLDREVLIHSIDSPSATISNNMSQHLLQPNSYEQKPTIEEVEDEEVKKERQWKAKLDSLDIPWLEEEEDDKFNEKEQQKLLEELKYLF
ncbi:hypothetical protein BT96DRAFT_934418 [Gymnopus androsaceus JB14]|uniref:Uncharacterized protein n=1 Tax=Gymnopus androsaceus JB14 TaxID=1447944 RepID=A0A6A4I2X5_9AGAR|nr:hypothetical protein BT96DRAFT_934418 [Gymnopus androsaceus JB14]